jgi:hypothetical protein
MLYGGYNTVQILCVESYDENTTDQCGFTKQFEKISTHEQLNFSVNTTAQNAVDFSLSYLE